MKAGAEGLEPSHLRLNRPAPYHLATPQKIVKAYDVVIRLHLSLSRQERPKSVQWELNPHFRHGKAAGYRYIMDA